MLIWRLGREPVLLLLLLLLLLLCDCMLTEHGSCFVPLPHVYTPSQSTTQSSDSLQSNLLSVSLIKHYEDELLRTTGTTGATHAIDTGLKKLFDFKMVLVHNITL